MSATATITAVALPMSTTIMDIGSTPTAAITTTTTNPTTNNSIATSNITTSPSPPKMSHPANVTSLFGLEPRTAMLLLATGIQLLVDVTGDVPLATLSDYNGFSPSAMTPEAPEPLHVQSPDTNEPIDGVRLRDQPSNAIIGANDLPLAVKHSAISRKFYCKKAPAIPISEYLARMHSFCPVSTAVYLAASQYIHHLARERAVAVTPRNAHRLVLAALRVAAKMHDDRTVASARMARVGGVSPPELGKMEVAFCFLMDFGLTVTEDGLIQHWAVLEKIQQTPVEARTADLLGFPVLGS